jgi:hypothetical protein
MPHDMRTSTGASRRSAPKRSREIALGAMRRDHFDKAGLRRPATLPTPSRPGPLGWRAAPPSGPDSVPV